MSDAPISVLLVDDHTVVRKGLSALLSAPRLQIAIAGEAADGVEAVEQARQLQPDVILMDLEMPRLDGIGAISQIKRENPKIRILVLTSFGDIARAKQAVQAGAEGFLRKDSSPDDLVHAIRSVYRGRLSVPAELALELTNREPTAPLETEEGLTEREQAVLSGLVRGLSNKEIATELNISPNTVRSHVRNILTKLQVANRTQAALYAVEHKLLDGD